MRGAIFKGYKETVQFFLRLREPAARQREGLRHFYKSSCFSGAHFGSETTIHNQRLAKTRIKANYFTRRPAHASAVARRKGKSAQTSPYSRRDLHDMKAPNLSPNLSLAALIPPHRLPRLYLTARSSQRSRHEHCLLHPNPPSQSSQSCRRAAGNGNTRCMHEAWQQSTVRARCACASRSTGLPQAVAGAPATHQNPQSLRTR